MNWEDIRYFLELSRGGSLSSASRARGVEHTTVARRVGALEDALDVRLFDRLPRGWRLTDAGRALLASAEALEQDAIAFEQCARGVAGLSGTVRVSVPPVVATHFLVAHLAAFTERHPEICVELSTDRRGANLLRAEADVALRVGSLDVPPGLIARNLCSIGYGLYGHSKWAASPEAEQVFVGFDASMAGSAQKQWLDGFAGSRRVSFRSNDLSALAEAAKQGLGIALLPHFMVGAHDGLLLLNGGDTFERPLSLLLHPDLRRSARVRSVTEFLTRLVRKHSATLAKPQPALGSLGKHRS